MGLCKRTFRACSHQAAVASNPGSAKWGATSWMPRGRRWALRPEGRVMAGNPPNVQGVWNIGLPVVSRPAGDGE